MKSERICQWEFQTLTHHVDLDRRLRSGDSALIEISDGKILDKNIGRVFCHAHLADGKMLLYSTS